MEAGKVPNPHGGSLHPEAISRDGGLVAEVTEGATRSIALLKSPYQSRRKIMTLPDARHQVVGASIDGSWVVFAVGDEPLLDSLWTLYAWNANSTAMPRVLFRAERAGVRPTPLVVDGRAFWTATVSAERSELHMTDLASKSDQVIRAGVPGVPFRYGSLVAWPEMAPGMDNPVTFKAADAHTGREAPTPSELTLTLRRPSFANADGETFVWIDDHLTAMHVFRAGTSSDVLVGRQFLQWPKISGDLIAFDDSQSMLVADLRSGSYTRVTKDGGSLKASNRYLAISEAAPGSEKGGPQETFVVDGSALPPLPGCSG